MPIYLANGKGELSSQTLSAIRKGGFRQAVVVGGTSAVKAADERALRSAGVASVRRLAGPSAYATNQAFASWAFSQGMGNDGAGGATINGYWDALAGGALCGRCNAVLVLASDRNQKACRS